MEATETISGETPAYHGMLLTVLSGEYFLSIPSEHIVQITELPPLEPNPGRQPAVRGLMRLGNSFAPVIDLRLLLGQKPLRAEREALVQVMHERERDHVAWLAELKISVKEGREFTKALDSTKCSFGRWLKDFHAYDPVLEFQLRCFERPHNAIHQLGVEVIDLCRRGRQDEANARIASVESTTMVSLIELFERFRSVLASHLREILVIMNVDGASFGIIVDVIESIRTVESFHNFTRDLSSDEVLGPQLSLRSGTLKHAKGATGTVLVNPSALRAMCVPQLPPLNS